MECSENTLHHLFLLSLLWIFWSLHLRKIWWISLILTREGSDMQHPFFFSDRYPKLFWILSYLNTWGNTLSTLLEVKCQLTIRVVYFKYSRANISDEEYDLELGKPPPIKWERGVQNQEFFIHTSCIYTVFLTPILQL